MNTWGLFHGGVEPYQSIKLKIEAKLRKTPRIYSIKSSRDTNVRSGRNVERAKSRHWCQGGLRPSDFVS
jgi:hypothetical protein